MKVYLSTSDAEAQGLREGRISLLVIPFDEQPQMEPIADYRFDLCYRGVFRYTSDGSNWLPFAPYSPGNVIGVKEAWARCLCKSPTCPGFLYRDSLGWNTRDSGRHFGAATMPRKAIRTRIICESVEAKRVEAITGEEVFRLGIDNGSSNPTMGVRYENMQRMVFEDEWHRHHPALPFGTAWAWFVSVELQVARPL
jgi:hypothetical protein